MGINKIKCKFIKDKKSKLPNIDFDKVYLCDGNKTLSSVSMWLRNQMTLEPSQSLFITVNKQIMMNLTLFEIYNKYKAADDCLYITYFEEHSYG